VRYAEGPSIECHHIPIEQPTSPFRFSAQVQARHSATTVATRYGRPRSADERQNATADWNSAQRGTFEPQSTLGDPRVNSVQQAIREAAEKGGYRYRSWKVNDLEPNEGYNALQLRALPEHLHDPDFWKALATARKWQDVNAWRFHWHRFIDHLADGGDVESFFGAL
jgi:hypothetical protein